MFSLQNNRDGYFRKENSCNQAGLTISILVCRTETIRPFFHRLIIHYAPSGEFAKGLPAGFRTRQSNCTNVIRKLPGNTQSNKAERRLICSSALVLWGAPFLPLGETIRSIIRSTTIISLLSLCDFPMHSLMKQFLS